MLMGIFIKTNIFVDKGLYFRYLTSSDTFTFDLDVIFRLDQFLTKFFTKYWNKKWFLDFNKFKIQPTFQGYL